MKNILKQIIVFIITLEAKAVLWRYNPKIVAVTGSVGKTSTKEAIASVLKSKFKIRKNQKSFNSEIGVPLVVLGCENAWLNPWLWLKNILKGLWLIIYKQDYPEWLVLEMGVERPKDMEYLVAWAKPNITVFTALAEIPSHVEFFASPKHVVREKSKSLKCLGVDDFAILNFDDDTVYDLKEVTKAHVVGFGFGEGADLRASNYNISPKGINFKVDSDGVSVPVRINNAFGKHHVYPALSALAVGKVLGLNFVDMITALTDYEAPPGRLKLLEGVKDSFILDDTYNSSPIALRAALDTIKDIPAPRKIVALGDMLELGKYTVEAHQSMAEFIIDAGVEKVFLVGLRAKFIGEALVENGFKKENIFEFSRSIDAAPEVEDILQEGDLVLVKGSQGVRMEKIVEEIMAHPEDKEKLLVRQEEAWQKKVVK